MKAPPAEDNLSTLIRAMQAAEGFEAASIGACVLGESLEPIFAYRAGEAMTPASTLKSIIAATALEQLGLDFRFETKLVTTKPFELSETGALESDLIVSGGGDPMLTREILEQWVGELKKDGLTELQGRVLADGRCYPEAMIPDSWDWGDVSNYYGAGPCGLNLDFNRFEAGLKPGQALGEPAVIAWLNPPLENLEFENRAITGAAGAASWASIYGGPYTKTLTIRGVIPLGSGMRTYRGAIPDPALHAAEAFDAMIERGGIRVRDEPSTMRLLAIKGQPLPDLVTVLEKHQSIPLIEIVDYLQQTSDNLVTECVLQKLIELEGGQRDGEMLVREHWRDRGLEMSGLRLDDGSGLARASFLRPLDLARVLWLARRGEIGEAFFQSFSHSFNGRVRFKGGAMSRVRTFTGFVTADNGSEFTFSLMVNNYGTAPASIDKWVTEFIETVMALDPD